MPPSTSGYLVKDFLDLPLKLFIEVSMSATGTKMYLVQILTDPHIQQRSSFLSDLLSKAWLPHTFNNPFSVFIVGCYKHPMEDKHTIFRVRFPMGDSAVTIMRISGVHLGQLPMEDLHSTLYYCKCQLRNSNTVPHGR